MKLALFVVVALALPLAAQTGGKSEIFSAKDIKAQLASLAPQAKTAGSSGAMVGRQTHRVDRVAAAVGVRVVHAGGRASVSRKTWLAAEAVVIDQAAADRCGRDALPRRAHVTVVTGAEATTATWATAIASTSSCSTGPATRATTR